ncbi:FAD-dependent oxidoreductase [Streptomyces sp. NPDC055287]
MIVGGSIGGVVTAHVLASRFDRVTVLDRDELPEDGRDRRGVPQAGHAHTLLMEGRAKLESLFPGITDELVANGAVPFDPAHGVLFFQSGRPRIRFYSGRLQITMSRPFLERTLRVRVRKHSNVDIRDRTAVSGFLGGRERVTGVVLEDGGTIEADLVVDATGRSARRTDRWLEAIGCPVPRESSVRIDVGYTTRLYRRGSERLAQGALAYAYTGIPPHDKRAVAVAPIEGGRWIVTLGGWHRAHAPVDPAGFEKFAAELPTSHISELLSQAEPLDDGDARLFTAPTARRRHYERLVAPPAGFAAVGDAICSFNPLYGQGMTVAVQEAIELGRCLDRSRGASAEMTRGYFREASRIIDTPWMISTEGDLMFPETVGHRPFGYALRTWYLERVILASHVSPYIHRRLLEVTGLVAEPKVLFTPRSIVRALAAARRSPARRTPPVSEPV